MKAITKYKYGGPEQLALEDIERPTLKDDHVLIKIKANSINPADWRTLRGKPILARFTHGLFKPSRKVLGIDFAGTVETVGQGVTKFKVGDRVFGAMMMGGAFSEYACVPESVCAHMPEKKTFDEIACMPLAGLTAFQALITYGKLREGESVLINGSSGGVGHLAVQIAKAYGAHVTAICSSQNIRFVKSIGADKLIDYMKEDIHQHNGEYDLVIDVYGNLTLADFKRMGKRGVMLGFTTMKHLISVLLKNVIRKFPLIQFTVEINNEDLIALSSLIQGGKLRVNVDKTYSYDEIADAIDHIEKMRTQGKIAISW